MGRKGGKYKGKEGSGVSKKKSAQIFSDDEEMMNDEIDAFHKNRDIVPLNPSNDMEDSDEDNEHPVFDFEDEDEDDEDEEEDEEEKPKGLAAKIVRTQKYLRSKLGGDDEQLDEDDEEDQEKSVWNKKGYLHGTDVNNQPQSSDDEDAAAEEAEVLKLQSEKSKVLSMEDFGLEDDSQDETDTEPTFEEILDHGKPAAKASLDKETKDDDRMTFEIVKKDLNAFTKEEQIDIVYSSAPELIGLLSELNDSLDQLDNKVTPLVNKIKGWEGAKKGEMHYLEVKQLLLQSFCQAITFYLLLKSEGQPVRDHPVVSRLVEIKSLLDKVKEMDEKLTFDMEDTVNKNVNDETVAKLVEDNVVLGSDSLTNSKIFSTVSTGKQTLVEPIKASDLNFSKTLKNTEAQDKNRDKQVGSQSMEMLKIRASLEEKLKQKGVFSSATTKSGRTKHAQPVNRQLETLGDFVDEPMEIDVMRNGRNNGDAGQLILRPTKRKVISGDDDIPKRDDIGERRRKHELRVLAGAGVDSVDAADVNGESDMDSDLEYYKQVEQEHDAKLAAKSDKYSRTTEVSYLPDAVVDGKRHISHQIDKNRGLTRARKKLTKNPRKKYKLKHQKAEMRRKGQVREVRKAPGHYGGEASGINDGISRSRRLQN